MSMTKRMMESRGGDRMAITPESLASNLAERSGQIAAVFEATRPYHHAFVKSRLRKKPVDVYRSLYPQGFPSTTKFYSDLKKAGSLPAYLTHFFYCNIQTSLESLGLPPVVVAEMVQRTSRSRQYILSLEDAATYAPDESDLQSAEDIRPRSRYFRHNDRGMSGTIHERSIQKFFSGVYAKSEFFYRDNPSALFKLELLDYEDYLQSPFWFVIRNVVLFRDGFKCRVCSSKATTVHHVSYDADVLYGKNLEPLVSLCEPCHAHIEFDENGTKISDLGIKKERYENLWAMRSVDRKGP